MKSSLLSLILALGLFLTPGYGFNVFSGSAINLSKNARDNHKVVEDSSVQTGKADASYAATGSQSSQHQIIWNKPARHTDTGKTR